MVSRSSETYCELFDFIREQFIPQVEIPLHVPLLGEREKRFLCNCIDTTFVSSIGPAINEFEKAIANLAEAKHAVAVVNGTAALQLALLVSGVQPGSEVITQSLTFIATANAISHCGAQPVFVDVDRDTLGLSAQALRQWLQQNTQMRNGVCVNRHTGKTVSACVCMHTFGHPVHVNEIKVVCEEFNLMLVEDAAEALGSRYQGRAVGAMAKCGIFSFNGNKIITTGGGGALVTNDDTLAEKARHLATTAKCSQPPFIAHDAVGYNFRMPSLNAVLGCAQLRRFSEILAAKRQLALAYRDFFAAEKYSGQWTWVSEPEECESNYWLNAALCANQQQRDELLAAAAANRIQMRPIWEPLSDSVIYRHCQRGDLSVTQDVAQRLINLPSSAAGSKVFKPEIAKPQY